MFLFTVVTFCIPQREGQAEVEARGAGGGLGPEQRRAALHPEELVVGGVGRRRLHPAARALQHVRRAHAAVVPAARARRRAAAAGRRARSRRARRRRGRAVAFRSRGLRLNSCH